MNTKIRNIGINVTGTNGGGSADILYTVPKKHKAEVTLFTITNNLSSVDSVSIEIYVDDDSTYYDLADTTSIDGNSTWYVIGEGELLNLNSEDQIVISSTSGNNVKAFVSVKEYYVDSV